MLHKVVIYPPGEETNILLDFYRKLPLSAKNKVLKEINKLAHNGMTSGNIDLKKLKGYDLWEIRIKDKDSIRLIICSIANTIYIVNIFKKKSNATPKRELVVANKRKELLSVED